MRRQMKKVLSILVTIIVMAGEPQSALAGESLLPEEKEAVNLEENVDKTEAGVQEEHSDAEDSEFTEETCAEVETESFNDSDLFIQEEAAEEQSAVDEWAADSAEERSQEEAVDDIIVEDVEEVEEVLASDSENPAGFRYELLDDGTVKITGYTGEKSGNLILPESIDGHKVSSIGRDAFWNCSGFAGDLVIPDGVTMIEEGAFEWCWGFDGNLVLPESLIEIGERAFYDCRFTGNLKLPEHLERIGEQAFCYCRFTGNLKLPEHLERIGDEAFLHCSGLTGELILPESLEYIGKDVFFNGLKIIIDGEEYRSLMDIRVGDQFQLTAKPNTNLDIPITSEIVWSSENENVVTVDETGLLTAVGTGTYIEVRASCSGIVDDTIDFNVTAAAQTVHRGNETWYIPQTIKLGYCVHGDDSECPGIKIVEVNDLKENYEGKYAVVRYSMTGRLFTVPHAGYPEYLITDTEKICGRVCLHYAIYPGTVTFQLCVWDENECVRIGEPYTVTVEEPVIATNEPQTVTVGDRISLTAELQNTDLENELAEPYVTAIESRKKEIFDSLGESEYILDHKLVYQPEFIIEQGANLVECSDGDFSHTLTASEQITFKGIGTVRIRIRYNPLPLCTYSGLPNYYVPEKTITIQVKDKTKPAESAAKETDQTIKVRTVALNQTTLRLQKGKTTTLSAAVASANASNKSVAWTTSNPKVATVSGGVVTAKGLGTATITARASDGSGVYAQCKVTVGYRITYQLSGGKNNTANPSIYYKEKITLKNPSRKGYLFKGWYTDKKYKKKIKTITAGSAKNLTLYAKWEKVTVDKTAIITLKSSKSGQAALKFKGISKASGYEVMYGTDRKFKKYEVLTTGKTSLTLKELKKKSTYYVKIRAYKLDSAGKKVYGKYSAVKKVKIQK
jgi:uncharacterized repeat protein (TIGR02543 family)